MRNFITTFCLFASFTLISQIDSANYVQIKTSPFTIILEGDASTLHLKSNDSKKKIKVKKGAIAKIVTKEDSTEFFCKILLFNDSGLYVSPYQRKAIHGADQGFQYVTERQLLDSICFVQYNQIKSFSFRNNLESKTFKNYLAFTVGTSLLITPPIIYGVDQEKSLFSEPSNPILMGIGATLITYSIYKFKKNIKLKEIDLKKFSFKYTIE